MMIKYFDFHGIVSNFHEMHHNGSRMAVQKNFEILKHVIWRFRSCELFHKIFKFPPNMCKNRSLQIS